MWMSVMQALFSCCGLQSVVLFSGSAYQNNLMAIWKFRAYLHHARYVLP